MAEMIELKQVKEKVILVGVSTDDHDDTEKSLDELEELGVNCRGSDGRACCPEPGHRFTR